MLDAEAERSECAPVSSRSTVPSGAIARLQAVLTSRRVIEKSNLEQDVTLGLKLRTLSMAPRHAVQLKGTGECRWKVMKDMKLSLRTSWPCFI